MKKIVLLLICLTIFSMPAINAISFQNISNTKKDLDLTDNKISKSERAPFWADGTFSGKWGLREYDLLVDLLDGKDGNGMFQCEIGNISGYYGKIIGPIYCLSGKIYSNNDTKISNITGIFMGRLLGGRIGDICLNVGSYDIEINEADYGAFGAFNDTNFDWRIMLISGPTFYMNGTFSKF